LTLQRKISISIVSHMQATMVWSLLLDLERYCNSTLEEVILTLNVPEELAFADAEFSFPLLILRNPTPMGFGANHNQAFQSSTGDFFCVLNPDVRIDRSPFDALLADLSDSKVGVTAPLVLGSTGVAEDSARRFPTFTKILGKVFSKEWKSDYTLTETQVDVDWVAGMVMLFRRSVFDQFNGFNEKYFLYYEDVDLCARMNLAGLRVVVDPTVQVIHHAQHSSHRSLKYLRWHVASLLRFLRSSEYRQLKRLKRI
jgi:N-acetylglucosaminyl-diphospho-decaprenol L-rhamnosyltransferase